LCLGRLGRPGGRLSGQAADWEARAGAAYWAGQAAYWAGQAADWQARVGPADWHPRLVPRQTGRPGGILVRPGGRLGGQGGAGGAAGQTDQLGLG
jgi:hypothetical protein